LDWNITGNVNDANADEHIPARPLGWYTPNRTKVDTSNAGFFMQGVCDPNEKNLNATTFYPSCTAENNNVRTGGVVAPTQNAFFIYDKAKDLSWLLKSIFEIHSDVKSMGIYFANSGAGAVVKYPAQTYDGTGSYESIGCDWAYTIHPRSNKFVLNLLEQEYCHPKGEMVPLREYNPLERAWCRDQVERDMILASGKSSLAAHNIKSTGPYIDTSSAKESRLWVLTFGQVSMLIERVLILFRRGTYESELTQI